MTKTLEQLREEFRNKFGMPEFQGEFIKHATLTDEVSDYWLSIIQAEREELRKAVEELPVYEDKFDYYLINKEDVLDLLPPKQETT